MSDSAKFYFLSVPQIRGNEKKYLNDCLDSGWVSSSGPWVDRFEAEIAKYVGVPKAVSVTSGTAGLHLALLVAGVKPGEEVLVPTLTFIAPVNTVKYTGAEPVFFDCDDKLNLDLDKVRDFIERGCFKKDRQVFNKETGRRVAAVLPVHVHGNLIDIYLLKEIVGELDLPIIEDATEALGSCWVDGRENSFAGTRGELGCYSFNGNKIITTGGGGMVVAKDHKALSKVKHLSTQAKADELTFVHDEIGYNYRLTSLSAAFGLGQLELLPTWIQKKREITSWYEKYLSSNDWGRLITESEKTRSNYWLNAVEIRQGVEIRKLVATLQEKRIQSRPIWKLNHLQTPYLKNQSWQVEKATQLAPKVLTLPSCPDLKEEDVSYIVTSLEEVLLKEGTIK